MIKSRLKILMAEHDINILVELEEQLKDSNLVISRATLDRLYHSKNIDKTYLDTAIKLLLFFKCEIKDLFSF